MYSRSSRYDGSFPSSAKLEDMYQSPVGDANRQRASRPNTGKAISESALGSIPDPLNSSMSNYGLQAMMNPPVHSYSRSDLFDAGAENVSLLDASNLTNGDVADAFRAQVLAACALNNSFTTASLEAVVEPPMMPLHMPAMITEDIFVRSPLRIPPISETPQPTYDDVSQAFRMQVLEACSRAVYESSYEICPVFSDQAMPSADSEPVIVSQPEPAELPWTTPKISSAPEGLPPATPAAAKQTPAKNTPKSASKSAKKETPSPDFPKLGGVAEEEPVPATPAKWDVPSTPAAAATPAKVEGTPAKQVDMVPAIPAPVADEPKIESPTEEEVNAEAFITGSDKAAAPIAESPKAESPKAEDAPVTESPKAKSPKAEAPVAESPKSEARADSPKADAAITESPKPASHKEEVSNAESPKVESPKDAASAESLKMESPKTDVAKAESPKMQSPKADVAQAEPPKMESPKADVAKAESPKMQSPKADVAKAESPKMESPKADVSKAESPKMESPKADVSKAESPKMDSPPAESPQMESPKAASPAAAPVVAATPAKPPAVASPESHPSMPTLAPHESAQHTVPANDDIEPKKAVSKGCFCFKW